MKEQLRSEKKQILLCEDEVVVCESLKMVLEREDRQIDSAHDGEAGLSMALEKDYDLIISDLSMPKMTGLEFLRAYRQHNLFTKAIIFSGQLQMITEEIATELAIHYVLDKPLIDIQLLDEMVEIILRTATIHQIKKQMSQ